MITRREVGAGLLSAAVLASTSGDAVSEAPVMQLSAPKMSGGMPLMQALKLRHSTREYADRPLPLPVLSDLLWAAFGVNRPSGDRTVPYWRHIMVIDLYAAMADGVWFFDAKAHLLRKHLNADIRAVTGQQDFVGSAPLNLVYVARGERMHDVPPEDRRLYASVDAGFIGQNVYLFCVSEGLASVFRAAIDYKKLAKAMQLDGEQFVTFAQTVGYPKS
jgi:nitroreductase